MEKKICRLFLASPNDTIPERKIVKGIVEELNDTLCKALNLTVELISWENATYPGVGQYAQQVINEQIGDDYDLFVGIMWKKFGTKTLTADSGTEEEYNRAIENYKSGRCRNVMFYFSTEKFSMDDDLEQISKVKAFKSKISAVDGAYYAQFASKKEFTKDFRRHLSQCLMNLFPVHSSDDDSESHSITVPSDYILGKIEEVGAIFAHPNVDEIKLSDIYVPPVLRKIQKRSIDIDAFRLSSAVDSDGIRYLISGSEASGKTSLAKYFFSRYLQQNLIPVLLNGMDFNTEVKKDGLIAIIKGKIEQQYKSVSHPFTENKADNADYLLIIDDFEKSAKGSAMYWNLLTHNLESLATHIIALSETQIDLLEITDNPPFAKYERYDILQFGPKQRSQLINNWFRLGAETLESEDANDLLRKTDEAKDNVNRILGRNYIASYPFYILGMLQTFEALQVNNNNYSLYGFYYENLINESLGKAIKNIKDTGFYYNFLTEYCYWLFDEFGSNVPVDIDQFNIFYEDYCLRYAIDTDKMPLGRVKSNLKQALIMRIDSKAKILQRYVYYFFVAKFISNNIQKEDNKKEIREVVSKMISRAFRNEYASILMFITHLSKDEWIVGELIRQANTIFQDYAPCRMEDDLDVINRLIKEIPKNIVGIIDVQTERDKQLEYETALEAEERRFDNDAVNYQEFGLDEDISGIDIVACFNRAMKTIDLLGEVAKKYWGDLPSEEKYELVLSSYNLGLRTLHCYLDIMDTNRDELVGYIKKQVTDRYIKDNMTQWDADLNRDQIKDMSDGLLFQLAFLASWVFLRRVSTAVGYDKLNLTYQEIMNNFRSNSYKLIDLSIDLNYNSLNIERISRYAKDMKKNHMSYMVLRELSIHHLTVFNEGYQDRERIFQLFDVDAKRQAQITGSKVERRN